MLLPFKMEGTNTINTERHVKTREIIVLIPFFPPNSTISAKNPNNNPHKTVLRSYSKNVQSSPSPVLEISEDIIILSPFSITFGLTATISSIYW